MQTLGKIWCDSYKPTWGHSDLCTLQLSPLYHRDEGIEKGSQNKYLCMVSLGPEVVLGSACLYPLT